MVDLLKEKSKYTFSVVDKEFNQVLKDHPVIDKKAIGVLKPPVSKIEVEGGEPLLKRTLELTNTAGKRGEKILTENLEYAEFRITVENIKYLGKEGYFINPYEQKIVFDRGTFLIDDQNFNLYVEDSDFKMVEQKFAKILIDNFSTLLDKEEISKTNKNLDLSIDEKKLLETYKSTIIKGW
jgi:hypothetical protein